MESRVSESKSWFLENNRLNWNTFNQTDKNREKRKFPISEMKGKRNVIKNLTYFMRI